MKRTGYWFRLALVAVLTCLWRFPELRCIYEDPPRLWVVGHGLRTEFRLHFAHLAIPVRRVLVKDVDPTVARGHKDQPRFLIVYIGIRAAADGK